MKFLFCSLFSATLLFATFAHADLRKLSFVMSKATPAEQKDLNKLLGQITVTPVKDPKTGSTIFKITKIAKGSVYEREGLKVGDLVTQ